MKEIILSKEEVEIIVILLRSTWVQPQYQKIVYDLISRIERELED